MLTRHTMCVAYQRDPVSELFDEAARSLLARAYANPGKWAGTRLADPSVRHIRFAGAYGIYPLARDTATGGEAKTRWARGFVRALYYQHKFYSPTASGRGWSRRTVARGSGGLVVEVGNVVVARGVIPRGRAVRVKLAAGGAAKARAVARIPEHRTWADQGPRWADPGDRDW